MSHLVAMSAVYCRLRCDLAVWSDLIIVVVPSLHFWSCVVKAHEPMSVKTFSSELAVEAFDEAVVRRFTRSREPQAGAERPIPK